MKIDDERNKRNNSLEGIDEMTLVMVLSSMFGMFLSVFHLQSAVEWASGINQDNCHFFPHFLQN